MKLWVCGPNLLLLLLQVISLKISMKLLGALCLKMRAHHTHGYWVALDWGLRSHSMGLGGSSSEK